jgi:hypothetical protein
MYNKLFTKILDSSVWLESTPTRIVWITLIAAMDETGFCSFAAPANIANRARVSLEETVEALEHLSSPDPNSFDPDNEGRRVEHVPGGWMVLNAGKFREIVTRSDQQQKTRERVRRFRERKRALAATLVTRDDVTVTRDDMKRSVTKCNETVTPSEAYTETTKAPPSRARDPEPSKPEKAPPQAGANGEFMAATWLLDELGLAGGLSDIRILAQVILYAAREARTDAEEAATFLRDVGLAARARGEAVTVFWYKDRKFTEENGNGKGKPSAAKQRLDGNRRALAEAAIKRGWFPANGHSGQSPAALAEPGHSGIDGGIPGGHREIMPEILAPAGGRRP